jgi:hypothetical protein
MGQLVKVGHDNLLTNFVSFAPLLGTTWRFCRCFYSSFPPESRTRGAGAAIDVRSSFANLCIASIASRRRSAARV